MLKTIWAAGCILLCACTAAELRVGPKEGIPAIKGNQEFSLGTYTCGMPIPAEGYTVTTAVKGSDCEFTFDQVVTLIKAADYDKISELKVSANLVQAIELEVKTLRFTDAATGTALNTDTYVKAVSLHIEGQQVADKSSLASLPATVRLEGAALEKIKRQVDARQPATVKATAVLLVPQTPKPPDRLKLEYDSQPTLIVGAGAIKL